MGVLSFVDRLRGLKGAPDHPATIGPKIEALQRQREDIATAPITREEAKALMHKRISDGAGAYAASLWQTTLERLVYHPEQDSDPAFAHVPRRVFAVPRQVGVAPGLDSLDTAICALLAAQCTPALDAIIDGLEWPANARPMEGRGEAIAQIDKDLAALYKARDEILAFANEVGVELIGDTKVADPRRRPHPK